MAEEIILIVDDDQDIREILKLYLEKEGFAIVMAADGKKALQLVDQYDPDLIFLDIIMPGLDGFETCQAIREKTSVPILFLSAKEDDIDKILGLRIGGDDYITKPFSPGVLIARVKAHLRRKRQQLSVAGSNKKTVSQTLRYPGLMIDREACVVKVNNRIVNLSAKEYQLLCLMAEHPDRVYNVDHIFELVWGENSLGDNRTVMVHISNLRKKIEADPSNPKYVLTVRGIGYKFNGFQNGDF
ncbi:response regulator transcription factor [Bacillaceae bacterium Marseille-Q3522]|nr:response regulator transcription factor [Bacillaceae bacterium Marseille-Q3522]